MEEHTAHKLAVLVKNVKLAQAKGGVWTAKTGVHEDSHPGQWLAEVLACERACVQDPTRLDVYTCGHDLGSVYQTSTARDLRCEPSIPVVPLR